MRKKLSLLSYLIRNCTRVGLRHWSEWVELDPGCSSGGKTTIGWPASVRLLRVNLLAFQPACSERVGPAWNFDRPIEPASRWPYKKCVCVPETMTPSSNNTCHIAAACARLCTSELSPTSLQQITKDQRYLQVCWLFRILLLWRNIVLMGLDLIRLYFDGIRFTPRQTVKVTVHSIDGGCCWKTVSGQDMEWTDSNQFV